MMEHTAFLAWVHDLKNHLAVIEEELETACDHHASPEAKAHMLRAREQTAAVLRNLTGQLVTAKARAGKLHAMSDYAMLAETLDEAVALARLFAPQGVTIEVLPGNAPAGWFFDRDLVRLALDASLDNACRFAHQRVQVQANAAPEGLCLQITNDLPPASDANDGHNSGRHGTGLGLSVCEAVAAAHHNKGQHGCTRLELQPDQAVFSLILP